MWIKSYINTNSKINMSNILNLTDYNQQLKEMFNFLSSLSVNFFNLYLIIIYSSIIKQKKHHKITI